MDAASLSDAWEAKAAEWVAWARTPGHDEFFERLNWPAFVRILPDARGATLDLGCGEGRSGRELAGLGHRVTGIDSSATLARLAGEGGGYERVACESATHMPFADGEFELAVAFMSLITVDDVAAAIHETARVLAPGGCFCIAILHPLNRPEAAMRDYFREHRTAEPVERDGVRMVFEDAHRPLSDYTGALADAGFVIEQLGEPRLVEDGAPGTALEKASRQPYFLHLRCRLSR
ncbi:MAG TPA: class I SAM-dependent methyltransferase [Solirubrobacteraceae bacterium]